VKNLIYFSFTILITDVVSLSLVRFSFLKCVDSQQCLLLQLWYHMVQYCGGAKVVLSRRSPTRRVSHLMERF